MFMSVESSDMAKNKRFFEAGSYEAMRANRTRDILDAALRLAETQGFTSLRRHHIAAEAGRSAAAVNQAFGSMEGLRAAVMRTAIERNMLRIVAQGLAAGDPVAMAAPETLKREALLALC